ncbi:MAG TPA: hypothetical protein ACHBZ9_10680 [Arsenophonus nasoniae]|uniref:hypothetical protein n=1 Tax=Arsenophonus nasoniae TaxID=638 RepID=UPI003879ED60
MGQVAFDTLKFVETLESAGLPKNQAKAISLAVRESHEAVDVATKADIAEVNRNIADVRKDLSAEIADVRKDMELVRKDLSSDIALIRKDVEHIATGLLLKLGSVIVLTISAATAIIKFF